MCFCMIKGNKEEVLDGSWMGFGMLVASTRWAPNRTVFPSRAAPNAACWALPTCPGFTLTCLPNQETPRRPTAWTEGFDEHRVRGPGADPLHRSGGQLGPCRFFGCFPPHLKPKFGSMEPGMDSFLFFFCCLLSRLRRRVGPAWDDLQDVRPSPS